MCVYVMNEEKRRRKKRNKRKKNILNRATETQHAAVMGSVEGKNRANANATHRGAARNVRSRGTSGLAGLLGILTRQVLWGTASTFTNKGNLCLQCTLISARSTTRTWTG